MSDEMRLLNRYEVLAKLGLNSYTTLLNWTKSGRFPKPVRLGPQRIAWPSTQVDEWIASLPTKEHSPS